MIRLTGIGTIGAVTLAGLGALVYFALRPGETPVPEQSAVVAPEVTAPATVPEFVPPFVAAPELAAAPAAGGAAAPEMAAIPDVAAALAPRVAPEMAAIPDVAAALAPKVAPETAAAPVPPAEAPPAPGIATELLAPTFDVVRVEPDGAALIAGRAPPGSTVAVLLDNVQIAVQASDGQGGFVVVLAIAPADMPRVLTLSATVPGGDVVVSQQSVILEPTALPPVATAAVAIPDPAPAATDDVIAALPASPAREAVPLAPGPGISPDVAVAPAALSPPPQTGAAPPVVASPVPPAPAVPVAAEPPAPRLLLADNSGIRVIQDIGPGPQALSNVLIDTITYDAVGDVLLGGRGSADGFVRVYLDNAPVRTIRIDGAGQWRTDLPRVDTRVYTLRVDEITETGAVVSRTETPFRPEDPARVISTGAADQPLSVVTVQPGFTLWRIARENYGEGQLYVRVFEANADQIRDPDLIFPGQIFTVPE